METLKLFFTAALISLFAAVTTAQNQVSRETSFYKSYEYEKSEDYASAIKEVSAIYKPADYTANVRLGWLYYLSKQYTSSIKYYQKAISLKPYAIEAKFGLIKPLSASENWEKVKATYNEILRIDPQNTVANYWLGVIYYNRKQYGEAARLFEKVINLYPLDYDSTIMLGWTYLNLRKSAEAKVLFNEALVIRPKDSSALAGLKQIK
ncbi:MAG TPA: tetratricopeptide repeat protein [Paludibacter sp.]|nr:tetratricopeptide repeat protein [Paludibacter sp.]